MFFLKSLLYLAKKNNLTTLQIKSIKEPSGKFTSFWFFAKIKIYESNIYKLFE